MSTFATRYTAERLRHTIAAANPNEGEDVEPPTSVEKYTVSVGFLDRLLFANGAVGQMWNTSSIQTTFPRLVVLHNNWIRGLRAKMIRLVEHHMWVFDRENSVCVYAPHPPRPLALWDPDSSE